MNENNENYDINKRYYFCFWHSFPLNVPVCSFYKMLFSCSLDGEGK